MAKSIETCKVIEKRTYYNAKPNVINGKCRGFTSWKRPYNIISQCRKCKFLYRKDGD